MASQLGCHGEDVGTVSEIAGHVFLRCPRAILRDSGYRVWLEELVRYYEYRTSMDPRDLPAVLVDAWQVLTQTRSALLEWRRKQKEKVR